MPDVGGDGCLVSAPAKLVTNAPAHGILVIERPPVEQIDVVPAVHARADPKGEIVVGGLGVEVANRDGLRLVAGEVEERRKEAKRPDDLGGDARRKAILATELELAVAVFVDAVAVGDDVRVAPRTTATVARDDDAAVGAELEVSGVARDGRQRDGRRGRDGDARRHRRWNLGRRLRDRRRG